jgi:hypothetical protein
LLQIASAAMTGAPIDSFGMNGGRLYVTARLSHRECVSLEADSRKTRHMQYLENNSRGNGYIGLEKQEHFGRNLQDKRHRRGMMALPRYAARQQRNEP